MDKQDYEDFVARLLVLERAASELVNEIQILFRDAVDKLSDDDVE